MAGPLEPAPPSESVRLPWVGGAVAESPSVPHLLAFQAASLGVRPLQVSDMAVLPFVVATLPLAAVELVEDGIAGFGWAGLVGFVVSSEARGGADWVLTVSALVVFFDLFMSPKARAVPLEKATMEVRMNAGASLRMCAPP